MRQELIWRGIFFTFSLFKRPYRFLYVTHATRVLQSHDLPGGGRINLWIIYILFWPHKDMEGLAGWGINSMPGPPPRQHKHERRYTPGTQSIILTRRIWNDDYGGQMIFGNLRGPKISWHLSYRWGKTPKKPHPGNLSRPGIEPGPLRDRRACYILFHSGGL